MLLLNILGSSIILWLLILHQTDLVVYCKMIVTNGTPKQYSPPTSLSMSWEDCLDYCMQEETCMVVSTDGTSGCQVFEIGMLQSVERSALGNEKVGFKTIDSDNDTSFCPIDDTQGGRGYYFGTNETSGRQIYNGYTFTYDPINQVWNFNSTGITMCQNSRWKMFVRPAGAWCLASVTNSFCVNQTIAPDRCASSFKGILSGLETVEEFEFIKQRANQSSWFNTTTIWKTVYAQWVDGMRRPECVGNPNCQGVDAFSFSDPRLSANPPGYIWNPNEPRGTGEDCLAFQANRFEGTAGIVSAPCDKSQSADNATCFNGYICGAEPT